MAKDLADVVEDGIDDDGDSPVKRKRRKSGGVSKTYNIPKALQREGVAKTVTMYELGAKEEQQASQRANFNIVKATHEATKAAIGKLDGKLVDNSEGDVDEYWETCGPQVRTLLVTAYERMHGTTKAQEKDFFDSEVAEAGDE